MDEHNENPPPATKDFPISSLLKEITASFPITLNHKGHFTTDTNNLKSWKDSLSLSKDDDQNLLKTFNKLLLTTDNNFDDLSLASIISLLPDPHRPDIDWLYSTTGKERKKHLKKLLTAFRETTADIFSEKKETSQKLKPSLNEALSKSKGSSLDFSQVDHQITTALYEKIYPLYPRPLNQDLEGFLKHPGVATSILALRKLFFIKLLDDQLGLLKLSEDHPLLLSPTSDIWNKMQSYVDLYYDFSQKPIPLVKFIDLSDLEIVNQLAFLAAENILRTNPQDFKGGIIQGKKTDGGKEYSYHLPISERPEEQLAFGGITFPTTVRHKFDSFEIYFNDVLLTMIPVTLD